MPASTGGTGRPPYPDGRSRGSAKPPAEALVLGDLPLHRHGLVRHPAARHGRRGEAGPEDDAVRQRVPGSDAQGEEAVRQAASQLVRDGGVTALGQHEQRAGGGYGGRT